MSARRHREVIDAIEANHEAYQPGRTPFERSHAAERIVRAECGMRGLHFGLPSAHARHFWTGAVPVVRLDRKLEKLRMDPARSPQHKVHQHGQEKHYAVA